MDEKNFEIFAKSNDYGKKSVKRRTRFFVNKNTKTFLNHLLWKKSQLTRQRVSGQNWRLHKFRISCKNEIFYNVEWHKMASFGQKCEIYEKENESQFCGFLRIKRDYWRNGIFVKITSRIIINHKKDFYEQFNRWLVKRMNWLIICYKLCRLIFVSCQRLSPYVHIFLNENLDEIITLWNYIRMTTFFYMYC